MLRTLPRWIAAFALVVLAGCFAYALLIGPVQLGGLGTIGRVWTMQQSIVAFAVETCPPGWKQYRDAGGRVLVGRGGDERTGLREFGTMGGRPTVMITGDNLPMHAHVTALSATNITGQNMPGAPWGVEPAPASVRGSEPERPGAWAALTSPAGSENPAPLDNMPPYTVVTFCTPQD